jgi:hypothetical protein
MAYTFLNHAEASSAGDNSRVDITDVDTSGANLIVAHVADFASSAATTFSDSLGNTWNVLTEQTQAGGTRSRIIYSVPSSVGSGHDFAAVGAGSNYPSMEVLWFSGGHATPFAGGNGVENGAASGGASTLQPGSITPPFDDELVFAGCGFGASATITINLGFSTVYQQDFAGGAAFGSAAAYLIQTTAAAVNPTFTASSGTPLQTAAIASFRAGAAAAGGASTPVPVSRFRRGRRFDRRRRAA